MTDLSMGLHPGINSEVLDAELRAALPGKLDGLNFAHKTGELTVIVTEGEDAAPLRGTIAAVIAAHDPNATTPQQQAQAAREQAAQAVAGADLAGLAAEVVAAKTLEDVRPALMQALTLLGQMAVAQGLVEPSAARAIEAVRAAPVEAGEGQNA